MSKKQYLTSCKRCGRGLSNPKSIERGYGPVCWKKVQFHDHYAEKHKHAKITDLGPNEIMETSGLIELKAEWLQDKAVCFSCRKPLSYMDEIRAYPHSGGIEVPGLKGGEEGRWWVYIVCDKCGYQNSWAKIMSQIETRKHRELMAELKKLKEKPLDHYFPSPPNDIYS